MSAIVRTIVQIVANVSATNVCVKAIGLARIAVCTHAQTIVGPTKAEDFV